MLFLQSSFYSQYPLLEYTIISGRLNWNEIVVYPNLTLTIFRAIDINSGISYKDGRANAVKSLIFTTCLETIVQLYSFIVNPALRLNQSNRYNHWRFKAISLVRLFSWKKIKKLVARIYFNDAFKQFSCKKPRSNRIVPLG